MTKLNMSEAARAAGITRATLYRHIEKGKLSKENDTDGNPVIDMSELLRVYPNLNTDYKRDTNSDAASKTARDAERDTGGTALLQLQLEQAQRERDTERERREQAETRERETKDEMQRLIGIIETQTRQLAAPKEELTIQPPHKRGFWGGLFQR